MTLRRAAGLALGIGGLIAVVGPSAMGYDAWAWQVWGRELLSFDLATDGGPSWKPLPVLLTAPFAVVSAAAAPVAWQLIAQASAVMALFLAYRVASRFGGVVAGLVAVVGLALSADFFVTALRAYSEPMLVALALGAIELHLSRHPRWALLCLALAGLLRPEAWVFLALYGLFVLAKSTPRERWIVVALVVVPPVLWVGLDWLGSSEALQSSDIARSAPAGSAAKADQPALTVFGRLPDTVILPILVFAAIAVATAVRRRMWEVIALASVVVLWTSIVAVMAEIGFSGARRYLAVAAAIIAVLAGAGAGLALQTALRSNWRTAVAVGLTLVLAGFAFVPARADWRLLGLAREQDRQLDELRAAVARVGGPRRVRAAPAVAVNPFVHTALAWELGVPLHDIQPTWTARPVRLPSGGLLFRAPAKLAGPPPRVADADADVRVAARAGRWRVLVVNPPR